MAPYKYRKGILIESNLVRSTTVLGLLICLYADPREGIHFIHIKDLRMGYAMFSKPLYNVADYQYDKLLRLILENPRRARYIIQQLKY